MRMMLGVLVVVLALVTGGCVSVTEADRQLEHQTLDAATLSLDLIIATGTAISPAQIKQMEGWLADIKANSAQLVKSHGPAENPLAYSKEASQKARDESGKSHEGFSWAAIGTAVLGIGTVLLGIAKSPWAKMIPGVGQFVGLAEMGVEGAERFMGKMKRDGKPEIAKALADELARVQGTDNILVQKLIAKVKGKLEKVLPKA